MDQHECLHILAILVYIPSEPIILIPIRPLSFRIMQLEKESSTYLLLCLGNSIYLCSPTASHSFELCIVELFDGSEAMCVNLLEKFILKCEHLDLKSYMRKNLESVPSTCRKSQKRANPVVIVMHPGILSVVLSIGLVSLRGTPASSSPGITWTVYGACDFRGPCNSNLFPKFMTQIKLISNDLRAWRDSEYVF